MVGAMELMTLPAAPTLIPSIYQPGSRTIEAIRQRVEAQRAYCMGLWRRFDCDQDLFDLKPFNGEEGFEMMMERGYRTYTSNDPKVYARKLMEFVEGAAIHVKIPSARETEQQRLMNQGKRDFLLSAFRKADRRLLAMPNASLKSQLGHFLTIRGWAMGRCLLRTDDRGQTIVDILPWDPRNVIWQMGPAGLAWACNVTYQTMAEMAANHPHLRRMSDMEMESPDRYLVYDYWDATTNVVFTDSGMEIKKRTRHGANQIPVFMTFTGGMPPTGSTDMWDALEKTGESCYAAVRGIYDSYNFVISQYKHLVAQATKRSYTYESLEGDKTLPDDPFVEGQEIAIKIGEKIQLLDLPEMAKNAGELIGIISGELQRGSLPHSAYGELAFQLSGYAIQTLRESISSQIMPIIRAAEAAYTQISDKLCAQYATGLYQSIAIPGEWDSQGPMMVRHADEVEISLTPHLPEDMAAKMAVAQMAREPGESGVPLFPDSHIREKIVGVPDEEAMQDLINEQQAERLTPTSTMLTMIEAAQNRGNEDLVNDLLISYQMSYQERWLNLQMLEAQLAQIGMSLQTGMPMPGGPMGGGQGAGPPGAGGEPAGGGGPGFAGVDPAAAPQQALGMPAQPALPQSGPFVPPGSPRPRARSSNGVANTMQGG